MYVSLYVRVCVSAAATKYSLMLCNVFWKVKAGEPVFECSQSRGADWRCTDVRRHLESEISLQHWELLFPFKSNRVPGDTAPLFIVLACHGGTPSRTSRTNQQQKLSLQVTRRLEKLPFCFAPRQQCSWTPVFSQASNWTCCPTDTLITTKTLLRWASIVLPISGIYTKS